MEDSPIYQLVLAAAALSNASARDMQAGVHAGAATAASGPFVVTPLDTILPLQLPNPPAAPATADAAHLGADYALLALLASSQVLPPTLPLAPPPPPPPALLALALGPPPFAPPPPELGLQLLPPPQTLAAVIQAAATAAAAPAPRDPLRSGAPLRAQMTTPNVLHAPSGSGTQAAAAERAPPPLQPRASAPRAARGLAAQSRAAAAAAAAAGNGNGSGSSEADLCAVAGDSGGSTDDAAAVAAVVAHCPNEERIRLKWSQALHERFLAAIDKLGGPDAATPKRIQKAMSVEGLTLFHIKSHLQKYRLSLRSGRRFTWSLPQAQAQSAAPANSLVNCLHISAAPLPQSHAR